MKNGTNKDPIDRTCRLINMFHRRPLTNLDVRNEFGISKPSAQHLIDMISRHFPIGEVGCRYENKTGPASTVYGFMIKHKLFI